LKRCVSIWAAPGTIANKTTVPANSSLRMAFSPR
jgi:hypothetical protein